MSGPLRNLLEPEAYNELFLRYPPCGLHVSSGPYDAPVFTTDFDLLTTMEPRLRRRLAAIPLLPRLLRLRTCFVGSTITEYAPLPDVPPAVFLKAVERDVGARQAMTIIKDVPQASPPGLSLVPEEDALLAEALAAEAARRGWLCVEGQALAFVRIDFTSTEDYLARLSSGRRKDIRRKLRKRAGLDVERVPLGDERFADEDLLDQFYGLYLQVYEQSEIHFDLLSREYFAALLRQCHTQGVVFCYKKSGCLIGFNICLEHDGRLIDKYIGLRYPQAREQNLYFINWMINLDYALEKGLHTYVAGWTDPQVKASLGANFTMTRHLVWMRQPLVRRVMSPFRSLFEADARAVGSGS